jgi:glycerophosphoryl diester phosphodiesterase
MYVQVWTINDEATMRDLIEMGVDGIMTDDPPLLTRVINELGVGD